MSEFHGPLTLEQQTREWLAELDYIKRHPYRFTPAVDVADYHVSEPPTLGRVINRMLSRQGYGGGAWWS